MTDERTHEQKLRDAINRDAGVVGLAALVDYLEARRKSCAASVMRFDVEQRSADTSRGKHAEAGDLLRILTTIPTENP